MTDTDLFGHPVAQPQIVRLDRRTDRDKPCCQNLAIIHPRHDGPHAAELRCADCGKHRGWLPKVALEFLAETTRRFGASTDPIVLRDQQIGEHMLKQQRDNSGILFKNDRKETDNHPDYTGTINVNGVEFYLNAWIKQGQKAKFMSLSVKPKETHQKATASAKAGDDFDDQIGF